MGGEGVNCYTSMSHLALRLFVTNRREQETPAGSRDHSSQGTGRNLTSSTQQLQEPGASPSETASFTISVDPPGAKSKEWPLPLMENHSPFNPHPNSGFSRDLAD